MSTISSAWSAMTTQARALAIGGLAVPLILVVVIATAALGGFGESPTPSDPEIGALPTEAPTEAPTPTAIPSPSGSGSPSQTNSGIAECPSTR